MLALGVDIGTTTISTVVVEDRRKVLYSNAENSDASFVTSASWEKVQDAVRIMEKTCEAVKQTLEQFPQIECIGITGQMHGIVYLDARGEIISPLYTWQDGRGNRLYAENETYAEHITRATGMPIATGMGFVTHYYNLQNGLVPPDAAVFCTIYDCLAMKLCKNSRPLVHPSSAASFGLFDVCRGAFCLDALEKIGINAAICPPLLETDGFVGHTDGGIPVSVGIGDNQASFLGAVQDDETLLVNIGTGSQLSFLVKEFHEEQPFEIRPYIRGQYIMVGSSLNGGAAFALLERFFCEIGSLAGGRQTDCCFAEIDRFLEGTKAPRNLPRINTQFFGTRKEPSVRASITELTAENFHAMHFIYGFLYGMSEELCEMYRSSSFAKTRGFTRLIGSGNGLRRNDALRRCLSDVFGMPLALAPMEEEAASGAAFFAEGLMQP